jgi:phosphocarrier protein
VEVIVQPLPSDKAIHAPRSRTTLPAVEAAPTRAERSLRVRNAKGLHLRAAQTLAQLAAELPGEVQVAYGGSKVNAKSLLGLTTLGASCGTLLEVTVDGPGAAGSLDRIDALFASGFEEGVDWSSEDGGGR